MMKHAVCFWVIVNCLLISTIFADDPLTPIEKYNLALKKAREAYILAYEKAEAQLDRDYRDAIALEMRRATPESLKKANVLNSERENHASRIDENAHPEILMGRIIADLNSSKWLPFVDSEEKKTSPISFHFDANGIDDANQLKLTRVWVMQRGVRTQLFQVLPDHWRGIDIHNGRFTGYARDASSRK